MIQLLADKIADVEDLVQAGITLMALIMVGVVWSKTKSFVPVVGALLLGAVVIWGVNNVHFLEQKVGEEFEEGSLGAVHMASRDAVAHPASAIAAEDTASAV